MGNRRRGIGSTGLVHENDWMEATMVVQGCDEGIATAVTIASRVRLKPLLVAVVSTTAALAMLVSACADTQSLPSSGPVGSPSAGSGEGCAADSKYPATPTVQQVSDRLKTLVDSHIPLDQRVTSVQGAERDPEILNRLAAVLTDAHYKVEIHNIDNYCNGQASANSLVTFKGETNEMQIPLTVDGNQWKLNNSWACDLMANADITSSMCRHA
jgi:hypothetical protein